MRETVRINLLGSFHIYRGADSMDALVGKSRKGMMLAAVLALQHGENVPVLSADRNPVERRGQQQP